jgi:hypothetical protein
MRLPCPAGGFFCFPRVSVCLGSLIVRRRCQTPKALEVWAHTATDELVHVHHMHLINREGRHEAAAEACLRIVDFCRQPWRDYDCSK